jgi:two-component system, OmpR family, phosphate regulon sensor histidine kinase PhoR
MQRRSLGLPITLGVVMIILLAALAAGWVLLAVYGILGSVKWAPLYWTLLTVGSACFVLVLVGVVWYLILSIKTINLNQRQSNFIDSVTHELKSPIASLKLYLQTLRLHELSREEQTRFYRHMLEDVERLDQLINHLLDAARLDKAAVEPQAEEDVDLSQLLRQCGETVSLRYRLAEDAIRLDARPCWVRARPVELEMIFRNLLDNAAKYADEERPRIAVEVRRDGEWAVARIADNGRGIPRHLRHKIFGRFVRLGLELERKKKGTGLGLYIVHTIVRRLRGKVSVLDGNDETGTMFEVRLPAVKCGESGPDPAKQSDVKQEGDAHETATEQIPAR